MMDKWTAYMQKARDLLASARADVETSKATKSLANPNWPEPKALGAFKPQGALPGLDKLLPGNPGAGAPGFNLPQDVVDKMGGPKGLYDFAQGVRNGQGSALAP
jgi:hypothetical protein